MRHKFEDSIHVRDIILYMYLVEFNFSQSHVCENRSGEVFPQHSIIGSGKNFPGENFPLYGIDNNNDLLLLYACVHIEVHSMWTIINYDYVVRFQIVISSTMGFNKFAKSISKKGATVSASGFLTPCIYHPHPTIKSQPRTAWPREAVVYGEFDRALGKRGVVFLCL